MDGDGWIVQKVHLAHLHLGAGASLHLGDGLATLRTAELTELALEAETDSFDEAGDRNEERDILQRK
jgi:hypothetical protein